MNYPYHQHVAKQVGPLYNRFLRPNTQCVFDTCIDTIIDYEQQIQVSLTR